MLDIPPSLTGTCTGLLPHATELELAGVPVQVCDPDEVLRRLPAKPRTKDAARRAAYSALREQLRTDRPVRPDVPYRRAVAGRGALGGPALRSTVRLIIGLGCSAPWQEASGGRYAVGSHWVTLVW
jgi:hypothetical protein